MTPAVLARLRLGAQLILPTSTSPAQGPVDVVRWLGALQGQDFPGALWSIGLRVPGATRATVEGAFNRGEIVRSWPLRGTLHVTAAEDLGWILSLTAPRMLAAMLTRHRQLGITASDLGQVRKAALELIKESEAAMTDVPGIGVGEEAGNRPVQRNYGRATRAGLFAAFEAAGQRTQTQRGAHLLWLLCVEGLLVQGPVNPEGKGTTQFFVRSEQWISKPRVYEREQALAELALRYFCSHGPATVKDFQWWSKLPLADIAIGLDQVREQLDSIECEGKIYLLAPKTAELLGQTVPGSRSLLLLPGFDEYLLGYTDRSAALAPHHAPMTVPGNNGMFKATVVAGGKVAGTWRRAQGAAEKQTQLSGVEHLELFDGLSPAQTKVLEKSAESYARFLSN